MKQKKDKAETAKAIFSKENLDFINEPDSKDMAEQRLLALSNAVESQYIDVGSNAYDSNLCKDGEGTHSIEGERRISCLLAQDELDKLDDELHQAFRLSSGDIIYEIAQKKSQE